LPKPLKRRLQRADVGNTCVDDVNHLTNAECGVRSTE
jgi:hypothetical protein